MSSTVTPLAALLLAGVTGVGMLIGVWTVYRFENWAVRHTSELIAFASGLLVSGALLHLTAESVALIGGSAALPWILGSFVALYVMEAHFVPHVHARGASPVEHAPLEHPSLGPLVILGLGVHSVVDGVSVGAGLSAGTLLGSVTALLVVVHKIPVGIASMSALYHTGMHGRRALSVSTLLAFVTPITVLISYFLIRDLSNQTLGVLLALAAGSFLYVGAADLLPEGQARGRFPNTLMFTAGAAFMALVMLARA